VTIHSVTGQISYTPASRRLTYNVSIHMQARIIKRQNRIGQQLPQSQ